MTALPKLVIPDDTAPDEGIVALAEEFMDTIATIEAKEGVPLLLLYDRKSAAHYVVCHVPSKILAQRTDIDAVLDPEESEEYKLNREIYEDTYAYQAMARDALGGRSFEDIVVEYDTSYRPNKPLKVYGGQHRVTAVRSSSNQEPEVPQGIRVYMGLSTEQRFEIATVNNTSIAVPGDLLDRMSEELLGNELRAWAQRVGMLEEGQNFADARSSEGIPTVRIVRTFVVNYVLGKQSGNPDASPSPVVCSSGRGVDKAYEDVRKSIVWNDAGLESAGKEFARLHEVQRERVLGRTKDRYREFANKSMHPSVVAGWAYVAGLLHGNTAGAARHFALPDSATGTNDPLNAAALVKARMKGVDPDTYRGLGSRISPDELGRMAEVFILHATKASQPGITQKLANAAIQSYMAKKARFTAEQAVGRL